MIVKTKVFLIPYAGASSFAYSGWKNSFDTNKFDPYIVELAGRGIRGHVDFYQNFDEAAKDIAKTIAWQLEGDYIIFGHSMGALLAFEAYYELMNMGISLPKHIFFSGRVAPHLKSNNEKIYLYGDERFLRIVSLYGGLPEKFCQPDIRKVFLPILRSDFQLLCDYVYQDKKEKIESNISILMGNQDFSTQVSEVVQWERYAGKGCHFYQFSGGHFFINEACTEIIRLISKAN